MRGGGVMVMVVSLSGYIELASPGQLYPVSKFFFCFFFFGQETAPVFSDSGIWADNSLFSLSLSLSLLAVYGASNSSN
jgi:hypothetical protein